VAASFSWSSIIGQWSMSSDFCLLSPLRGIPVIKYQRSAINERLGSRSPDFLCGLCVLCVEARKPLRPLRLILLMPVATAPGTDCLAAAPGTDFIGQWALVNGLCRRYAARGWWDASFRGFRLRLHPRLKAGRRCATFHWSMDNGQWSMNRVAATRLRDGGRRHPTFRFAPRGADLCRPQRGIPTLSVLSQKVSVFSVPSVVILFALHL
jgi:hypothetical protein